MFVNPDGTATSEQSLVPKRVRRGNGWVPVDTSLKATADGVSPTASVLPMVLAGTHFPLYTDSAFHGPTPSRWAYSNNANESNDTSTLQMGRNPTSGAIYRPLFEFPVGVLVGSRILSATFRIQLYHSWSCGATPVVLWRANGIASIPQNPWASSG